MQSVRIAVLDSGIADEIIDSRIKCKAQLYWDYSEGKVCCDNIATDYHGHGTACVKTILNICPMAEIYVVKFLGIAGAATGRMLVEALRFANDLKVDVIALASSFIVASENEDLKNLCQQISNENKILVAAVQNGKPTSIIASYRNVIGVSGAENMGERFYYNRNSEIQMICDSSPIIVRGRKGIRQVFQGNSKATAVATGIISNCLLKHKLQSKKAEEAFEREAKESRICQSSNHMEDFMFSEVREEYYAENDIKYQMFIYLLCECLQCCDVMEIRHANLLEYDHGILFSRLDAFIELIEERFKVVIEQFLVTDLTWAYLFYEKHVQINKSKAEAVNGTGSE